jgi:hypothetical protein
MVHTRRIWITDCGKRPLMWRRCQAALFSRKQVVIMGLLGQLYAHATSAYAQQMPASVGGDVVGYATIEASKQPLGFADAIIMEIGIPSLADVRGVFHFRGLPPGAYTVRIRRIGFTPASVSIVITAGHTDTSALVSRSV